MSTGETPHLTLGRNTVFAACASGSAVLLLVLAAVANRTIGVADWGRFQWALTLATLGETLMDLGIHQVTIRSIARDRGETAALFRNSLALKALTGLGMLLLMGALVLLVEPDANVRTVSWILLVSAVLRSYLLTVRGVLQGLEQFGRDALVVIGDRALLLTAGVVALEAGTGLLGLAVAFVVARLIAVAGALALARGQAGGLALGFDFDLWRSLQRRALPIGVFLIVLNFYNYVDTFMLGVMTSFRETGLYANAYRLYEGLSYAPAILSAVLTPRLSHLWRADRRAHRRYGVLGMAAAAALALLVGALVWGLATPLCVLVYDADGAASATALRLLVVGLPFLFVIWILHAVAISVFREGLLMRATAAGAALNLLLNLYLIPHAGRNGAALATVLSELATMAALLWGLRAEVFRAEEPGIGR